MTQISYAKQGKNTSEIRKVAVAERLPAELIRKRIAAGRIVIPCNPIHAPAALGTGEGLRVKVNANIGTSGFMQNFRIRDGTAGFHTLLNGARIYDRLMRKWLAEVAAFTPPLLTLRYEDLVRDVRGHVERLAGFLGVPWDERLLDHAGHALSRGRIHTPSYAQVVQPVYTSAVARWKRYERHFGPALEVLAPWIHHWGYDETRR